MVTYYILVAGHWLEADADLYSEWLSAGHPVKLEIGGLKEKE